MSVLLSVFLARWNWLPSGGVLPHPPNPPWLRAWSCCGSIVAGQMIDGSTSTVFSSQGVSIYTRAIFCEEGATRRAVSNGTG